jgi:hypothetical protein
MVYSRFYLSILLPFWSVLISHSFFLIFFSPFISSSSNIDNRAMTIVKSIDDYLCQNYVFTCFFREKYHQLFDHPPSDHCKSLLILHSCLHYDTDLIRMCRTSLLNQTKKNLTHITPVYCFTSSAYKIFSTQHLRSIALPRTTINGRILVFFLLLVLFVMRMRTCC